MKCKITQEEDKFEPVTLTIVLESKQEVATMWHYMNQAEAKLVLSPSLAHYDLNPSVSTRIWDKLDALVRKLDMRAKRD